MGYAVIDNSKGERIYTNTLTGREDMRLSKFGARPYASNQPARVELFDDFLGDLIADEWAVTKGSDAQSVVPTIIASQTNGFVRLTGGDAATDFATSGSALSGDLNWEVGSGNFVFEACVRPLTSIVEAEYFVGMSDSVATTTFEQPVSITAGTPTYTATDAFGFTYNAGATTAKWTGVAVANATAGTKQGAGELYSTVAPAAATKAVLRVEVTAAGVGSFYIDGSLLGTVTLVATPTVPLTPYITCMSWTTGTKSLDVDYVLVGSDREI